MSGAHGLAEGRGGRHRRRPRGDHGVTALGRQEGRKPGCRGRLTQRVGLAPRSSTQYSGSTWTEPQFLEECNEDVGCGSQMTVGGPPSCSEAPAWPQGAPEREDPGRGPETGKGRRGGSQIGQVSGRGRFQQEAGGSVRGQQGRSRAAPDPGPGAFSCKGSRLCHFIKELCIRGKVSADLSKRQVRKAAERGRRLHDVISAFPSSFGLSGTFPRGVRGGPRPLFKHSSSALLRVTQGRGRDTLGTARPGRVGGARHTQGTAN